MQFMMQARRKTESFTEEQFAPLLPPEAEHVRKLYAAGSVRAAWGRKDVAGAVLLIEAESLAAAQAIADGLPLAKAGMLETHLIELSPYRGFGA